MQVKLYLKIIICWKENTLLYAVQLQQSLLLF